MQQRMKVGPAFLRSRNRVKGKRILYNSLSRGHGYAAAVCWSRSRLKRMPFSLNLSRLWHTVFCSTTQGSTCSY